MSIPDWVFFAMPFAWYGGILLVGILAEWTRFR